MSCRFGIRLLGIALVLHGLATSAQAYKKELQIPLLGCQGKYEARGFAKSVELWSESGTKDRRELIVQIRNMPLKPGTVLVVTVDDVIIGHIKLDARRNGSLKITSEQVRNVPLLDWGTSVMLTRIDGTIVSW